MPDLPRGSTLRPRLAAALAAALLAALLLVSGAAVARDYEVEIIVFDRLEREAGRAPQERWDFSSARIAARLNEMKALAARASAHPRTAQLASLEPLRERLLQANYRILDTARWRQPATFYPNAPVIALGGARDDGDGDAVGDDGGDAEAVVDDGVDGEAVVDGDATANADNPLAAGFVRVYRTALIYADLNLQLSPPVAEESAPGWPPHYFIAEKRRLKFKQIHYFDHPLFGALLQVWPVEVDETAEDEAAPDLTSPQ